MRNAQRAFFQAALDGRAEPTSAAAASAPGAAVGAGAPDPGRPLRPGSLLDIKV